MTVWIVMGVSYTLKANWALNCTAKGEHLGIERLYNKGIGPGWLKVNLGSSDTTFGDEIRVWTILSGSHCTQ